MTETEALLPEKENCDSTLAPQLPRFSLVIVITQPHFVIAMKLVAAAECRGELRVAGLTAQQQSHNLGQQAQTSRAPQTNSASGLYPPIQPEHQSYIQHATTSRRRTAGHSVCRPFPCSIALWLTAQLRGHPLLLCATGCAPGASSLRQSLVLLHLLQLNAGNVQDRSSQQPWQCRTRCVQWIARQLSHNQLTQVSHPYDIDCRWCWASRIVAFFTAASRPGRMALSQRRPEGCRVKQIQITYSGCLFLGAGRRKVGDRQPEALAAAGTA